MSHPIRVFFLTLPLVAAGCGSRSGEQPTVRPADAMLTLAQVQQVQASGLAPGGDLRALTSMQACGSLPDALAQITKASGGALRFEGNGVLTVRREVWVSAPAELRNDLAQALALSYACEKKTSPQDLILTVRDSQGNVLARGPLRSIVG